MWPAKNTYHELTKWIEAKLDRYDVREQKGIARLLLEHRSGESRAAMIARGEVLKESDLNWIADQLSKLNEGYPIQYLLQEAWCYGRKFFVDHRVLIPRPETEELIDLALSSQLPRASRVLDIGTGSGIIPVTLKLERPPWTISAWDVSAGALEVAQHNAKVLGADVRFREVDVLMDPLPEAYFDLIISNPPYIPRSDQDEMDDHVVNHEPEIALFVDDQDPLVFYHRIMSFALNSLKPGGILLFEIHRSYGQQLLESVPPAFEADLIIDAQGNDRILRLIRID